MGYLNSLLEGRALSRPATTERGPPEPVFLFFHYFTSPTFQSFMSFRCCLLCLSRNGYNLRYQRSSETEFLGDA